MNGHLTPINGSPRRRRSARPLPLHTVVPEVRTAAAMDDQAAAEQLIADLLALVDAGLVVPVEDAWGDVRYALAEPEEPHDGDEDDPPSAA
jgi:hypothetical protein